MITTSYAAHGLARTAYVLVLRCVVVVLLLVLQSSAAAAGGLAAVTVRIYNQSGDPLPRVQAAQRLVSALFQDADLEIRWRLCRSATGPWAGQPDRCDDALGFDEVVVRVARANTAISGEVLGYAHVDTQERAGVLATVFLDHIKSRADADGVPREHLLGLSIAHELGHLLMGTAVHGKRGLMKAGWSPADIQWGPRARWSFSPSETHELAVGLSMRSKLRSDWLTAGLGAGDGHATAVMQLVP